ncbi:MAG: NfeD family protein [Herbaspirillum sp.]|nr:NfeD family protein [Herbaspirillum sp.]
MADWAIWMLLTGVLVGAEMFTGTFYLLMLALGMAAGGFAAYAGLMLEWQLIIAAGSALPLRLLCDAAVSAKCATRRPSAILTYRWISAN